MAQRIVFFFKMTQRIAPSFLTCLKDLSLFFFGKKKKIFKKWTFRKIWLKQLVLFQYDLKNWTFFFECDSKNWFFFDSKNWTLFSNMTWRIEHFSYMTRRIEPSSKIWLKELNKDLNFIEPFLSMKQRFEFFE